MTLETAFYPTKHAAAQMGFTHGGLAVTKVETHQLRFIDTSDGATRWTFLSISPTMTRRMIRDANLGSRFVCAKSEH